MDADAMATSVFVMEPAAGVQFVNGQADCECFVIGSKGDVSRSRGWQVWKPHFFRMNLMYLDAVGESQDNPVCFVKLSKLSIGITAEDIGAQPYVKIIWYTIAYFWTKQVVVSVQWIEKECFQSPGLVCKIMLHKKWDNSLILISDSLLLIVKEMALEKLNAEERICQPLVIKTDDSCKFTFSEDASVLQIFA